MYLMGKTGYSLWRLPKTTLVDALDKLDFGRGCSVQNSVCNQQRNGEPIGDAEQVR